LVRFGFHRCHYFFRFGGRIYLFGRCTTWGCIRYCAQQVLLQHTGVYGIGFLHERVFRGWDRCGFMLGSRNERAGSEATARAHICMALALQTQRNQGGQKGATKRHTNTKTRFAMFINPHFPHLLYSESFCVSCICAPEYVADQKCVTE
jgi:hypothetical protein